MELDKSRFYRLPWSKNDNSLGWLETTDVCNLYCKGCYRQKLEGHKPLEKVKQEVLFLKKWRNCDNISIAGGESLLHPDIVEIVAFIARNGMKPMLLSNGMALTKDMLVKLKKAGLVGIVLHIDMYQERPGWKGKNEDELCELRMQLADMIYKVGGISCNYNITVYKGNMPYIPSLVRWAVKNSRKVNSFTFITYRSALIKPDRRYMVDGNEITMQKTTLGYASEQDDPDDIVIKSTDIYALLKDNFPDYENASYLGGTIRIESFKWVVGAIICCNNRIIGAMGKKAMEVCQVAHHLVFGRYFVYPKKTPGRSFLLLSLFDPLVRKALFRYVSNPFNILFHPVRVMGIGIIQAPDILEHGDVDMCDSCPDMIEFNGQLVNSCRLDEYRKYGTTITPIREK